MGKRDALYECNQLGASLTPHTRCASFAQQGAIKGTCDNVFHVSLSSHKQAAVQSRHHDIDRLNFTYMAFRARHDVVSGRRKRVDFGDATLASPRGVNEPNGQYKYDRLIRLTHTASRPEVLPCNHRTT